MGKYGHDAPQSAGFQARQGESDGAAVPVEESLRLAPRWDSSGLITGVVTDARTGELLMVAHLNAEALAMTQSTGDAHFWSRSRGRLWRKGETSGHVLKVVELRIDCDQDALWIRALPAGPACHTGAKSCFYRRVEGDRLVADTMDAMPHDRDGEHQKRKKRE